MLIACLLALAAAPSTPDRARAWEAPLVIPTYGMGPESPNPVYYPAAGFGSTYPYGRNYPYTNQDSFTGVRADRTYRALYLENRWLKVTVLPEIGGRLYAMVDKRNGREIFYTNHVIKPAVVAQRGAWVSGGVELNFPSYPPNEHYMATMDPLDFTVENHPDGSASVVVGEVEHLLRMQWYVRLTLRPDAAWLEQETVLHNRTDTAKLYIWWNNAAIPDAKDLELVYPMTVGTPDLRAVMSYPIDKGVDYSMSRNIDHAQSIFAYKSRRDFFGGYYQEQDFGIVHVADHHEVPGKKIWSWGQSPDGQIWVKILTDADGQYLEIQSGRYEVETDYQLLDPHRVERLMEYWYPVLGMGSFRAASREAAVQIAPTRDRRALEVAVLATETLGGAELIVESGGARLLSKKVDLSPDAVHRETVKPWGPMAPGARYAVELRKDGRTLVRYDSSEHPANHPGQKVELDQDPHEKVDSAERRFLSGLALERRAKIPEARKAYEAILATDPGDTRANLRLGALDLQYGNSSRALERLRAAALRNPADAEVQYHLGLALRANGRSADAEYAFWECIRRGRFELPASFALGVSALARADWADAKRWFERVLVLSPYDSRAAAYLAFAERRAGRGEAARAVAAAALEKAPLDPLLNLEAAETATVTRLFARDPEAALEVWSDYLPFGKLAAEERKRALELAPKTPMVLYTLAAEDPAKAAQHLAAARALGPDYVFPYRPESVPVLEAAAAKDPRDAKARLYLGNLLYGLYRFAEGIERWEQAVKLAPLAVAWRNLGLARWQELQDRAKAAEAYAQAVGGRPAEWHTRLEQDHLLAEMGREREAYALLKDAPEKPYRVRLRLAYYQVLFGEHDAALDTLANTSFVGEELGWAVREVYVAALLGRGYAKLDAKDAKGALADFEKALEYPESLLMAKPAKPPHAPIHLAIARAQEALGDTKAASRAYELCTREGSDWAWVVMLEQARCLAKLGRPGEAEKIVAGLRARREKETSKALLDGLLARWAGDTAASRAALDQARRATPLSPDVLLPLVTR